MPAKVDDATLLAALVGSINIREASEKCGLTERQIRNRLKSEPLKSQYREAKHALIAESLSTMQTSLGEAVGVIREIMNDQDTSPQIRLNAAQAVITNSLRVGEHVDILERLDALEGGKR